jgi:ATP-dependent Clp protease protease subunit
MGKLNTTKFLNTPFFRADVGSNGVLELLCYADIGESWDGAGITAAGIKAQLDAAPECSSILLRINSAGGDAFEGIAIFNLLKAQKKPIEVHIDGLAASAASILAMCGHDIIMAPNSMLMVHNAWCCCCGYASDMTAMAVTLDKISGQIARTYSIRTHRSMADVQELMDAETWLTADEALKEGFCTEVEPDPDSEIERNALAVARRFRLLAKLRNVPDRFKAGDGGKCDCTCQACIDGDCLECSNPDCDDVNCVDCPAQARVSLDKLESQLERLDAALTF